MKEQFTSKVCAMLSSRFSADDLREVRRCISVVLADYDVVQSETALVPFAGVIPEAMQMFLVSKKIEGKSENTIKEYGYYLKEFFSAVQKQLKEITPIDIRVFLLQIQEQRKISNQSVEMRRITINHFFNWCVDNDYIDKNPAKSIKPIKCEQKQREALTEIELEKMRFACDNLRDKALIEFLYSTACRVSEVAQLNRNDVNLFSGSLTVRGKGNKYRTVFLNAKAKIALANYLNSRDDDKESLFASLRNPHDRISKNGIEKIIRVLGEKAGIERRVYPHLLRHTTATLALQRGMPVTEIQKMLGHSNINTTMIYAQISEDAVQAGHHRYVV